MDQLMLQDKIGVISCWIELDWNDSPLISWSSAPSTIWICLRDLTSYKLHRIIYFLVLIRSVQPLGDTSVLLCISIMMIHHGSSRIYQGNIFFRLSFLGKNSA